MVYSWYEKRQILHYHQCGLLPPTIAKLLEEEGTTKTSQNGVAKFIKKFELMGSIARTPGSGRPSKITTKIKEIIEEKMREDDETTAMQLHVLLAGMGYNISKRTTLCCRTALGWTFRGSAYCQLIREANKLKCLEWVQQYRSDAFDNVVWTDECSMQLEIHKRFCCRKTGEPPCLKPRYVINNYNIDKFLTLHIIISELNIL